MNEYMNQKKSVSPNIIVFGLGLVAGWFAKHLFESPEVQQKKEEAMASVAELQERLLDSDEVERAKEIFGNPSEELAEMYSDAKEELISGLADLKVTFKDLDKTKYLGIVGEIVTEVAKNRELPDAQLKKLRNALEADFGKLRDDAKSASKTHRKPTPAKKK